MAYHFSDAKVLVVNEVDSSRKMLNGVLKILGVKNVDLAFEATDGFRKFKEQNHDVVFSALISGTGDAITLANSIRNDAASPNGVAPIIAIGGPKTAHLMDAAREHGITDLLQAPFTVNDVADRLKYVLSLQHEQLEDAAEPQEKPEIVDNIPAEPEWPDNDESHALTEMLLDHYMRHHEIVLTKLKFTQSATKHCIDELRNVHEKIKEKDNTNIHTFQDFDTMWEDIIQTFMDGGISEEELFKIEQIVTTVPKDIKTHYDALSQQDKSFMALIESLNSNAYKKAKERVVALQAKPNPLNGKTREDYKEVEKTAEEEEAESTIFNIERRDTRKKTIL